MLHSSTVAAHALAQLLAGLIFARDEIPLPFRASQKSMSHRRPGISTRPRSGMVSSASSLSLAHTGRHFRAKGVYASLPTWQAAANTPRHRYCFAIIGDEAGVTSRMRAFRLRITSTRRYILPRKTGLGFSILTTTSSGRIGQVSREIAFSIFASFLRLRGQRRPLTRIFDDRLLLASVRALAAPAGTE